MTAQAVSVSVPRDGRPQVYPPWAVRQGPPCLRLETLRAHLRSREEGSCHERHALLLLGHAVADLRPLAGCSTVTLDMPQSMIEEGLEVELRDRGLSCATWRALQAELGHLARIVSSAAVERQLRLSIGTSRAFEETLGLHSRDGETRVLAIAQVLSAESRERAQPARDFYRAYLRGERPAGPCGARNLVAWGRSSEVQARLRELIVEMEAEGNTEPVAIVSAELGPEARWEPRPDSAFPVLAPTPSGSHAVVLVTAPFAPAEYPALGITLLRESLAPRPPIVYLTLAFAEVMGVPFYRWIMSGLHDFPTLLGEWIFSQAGGLAPTGTDYLEAIACRKTLAWLDGDGTSAGELFPIAMVEEIHGAIAAARRCLDDWSTGILSLEPRVVGFTSTFQQNCGSLALARKIKEKRPDLIVVFGGSNWEGEMGLAHGEAFPFVDVSVSGEADHVFPELVRRLLDGADLAGLSGVRTSAASRYGPMCNPTTGPKVDVNGLPYPCFDDFFEQWKASPVHRTLEVKLLFETARGCWWGEKSHCTFCGLNGESMAFRSKAPRRALDEIYHLARSYPGFELAAVDNILDMRYFSTVIEELARTATRIGLFYEVKANLSKKHVELLSRAGVRAVQPGVESLSDHVLALMGKGITALQNLQLVKWCTEYAILPYWNLIWGFPGERVEDYEDMTRLLPLVSHLSPPYGVGPIRLDRFSPNHFDARRRGFTNLRAARAYSRVYEASPAQLDRMAYYFDYDYLEGRSAELEEAVDTLRQRLGRWRLDYRASRLTHVAAGDGFLVFDSRPCATDTVHHLEADLATVFALCDRVRSVSALDNTVGDRRRTLSAVGELAERGLALEIDGHVLALSLCAKRFAATHS